MAVRLASTRVFQRIIRNSTVIPNSKSILAEQRRCISLACQAYKRYFTDEHEWVEVENDIATVGITDHAQAQLGELVYVELPEVDNEYDIGDTAGVVESVKAASDVMSPLTGVAIEVNELLVNTPQLMNKSPECEGWMFKMKISDATELENMMDAESYQKFIEESD